MKTFKILLAALGMGVFIPIYSQVVQTDWTGGSGVCGTVPSFGSTFCNASPSMFYLSPNYLRLAGIYRDLREHLVDNTIGGWDNDPDIVDLNLDGANDLLVSDESGPNVVYWYRNSGCGSFTRYTIDPNIASVDEVVAIDYQNDGDMDVFAASHPTSGKDVVLYRNNGDMSFTTVVIDPNMGGSSEAEGIDAGDLDNDGDVDVAVSWLAGGLWWYENTGSGWTKRMITNSIGCAAWDVVIGDFNNDGRRDIALATACRLYIFRNDGGSPLVWTPVIIDNTLSNGYGLTAGDINGDGRLDLVLTDRGGTGYVYLYINNGGLTFTKRTVDNNANRPMGVQIADFEPDGDLDIAVASYGNRIIYVYEQTGALTFVRRTPTITNRDYFGVGIGDLDGDADPDILVRAGTTSTKQGLWWYETILQYSPNGWLESSIYDAGVQRRWLSATVGFSFGFSLCSMSGVLVKLYVRASKDLVSWTPWVFVGDYTATSTLPLPSPFTTINYRYLQYRLELYASSDQTKSPIIDYVRFDYDPLGGDDELSVSENVKGNSPDYYGVYTVDGKRAYEIKRGIYFIRLKNGRVIKKFMAQ
ncbi:MAG: VCBS repeat-containing protein [candidate division WOR-3 bacterium]